MAVVIEALEAVEGGDWYEFTPCVGRKNGRDARSEERDASVVKRVWRVEDDLVGRMTGIFAVREEQKEDGK